MALTCAVEREWQFLDLLCANNCADLRSFRLDGGRISHHGQRFRHSAGLQREFERGCRVDLDNDSRLFLDPKAGGGGAHVIRANTNVLNAEAARRAGDGVVIRTSFRAGDGYFGVGNGAAGAVEDGAGDGAAVGLSESRYCGEGKEKTNEKKPQQGQIESHSPPQLYRTVNKPSTSAASESQKTVRRPSEALRLPPTVPSPARTPRRALLQAVSETGYLVLVYQCRRRVLKFFFSLLSVFSMAVVWGAKS